MSRDGNGNYSLPQPAFVAGTTISSSAVNSNYSDIASAITQSVSKDGQTPITGNQPMSGFRHTGAGNAAARTDYATAGQVQDGSLDYGGVAGGTTTALTITVTPSISSYATGAGFSFFMGGSANGGATTLNVNAIGAKNIYKRDGAGGLTALVSGDLPANVLARVVYDGTQFQMITLPQNPNFNSIVANGGSLTGMTSVTATSMTAATLISGSADGTASPGNGTIKGASGSGANIAGGVVSLAGGASTGNAVGGYVKMQTSPPGGAGSGVNALVDQVVVDDIGRVLLAGSSAATGYTTRGDMTSTTTSGARFRNTVKAWVCFDGNTGTIRDSFNVTSVTKNATGDYTVNFTTAAPNTNYAVSGSSSNETGQSFVVESSGGRAVGSVRIVVIDRNTAFGGRDQNYVSIQVLWT
jgi:hypothetical protein